jgi:hypothetical protein
MLSGCLLEANVQCNIVRLWKPSTSLDSDESPSSRVTRIFATWAIILLWPILLKNIQKWAKFRASFSQKNMYYFKQKRGLGYILGSFLRPLGDFFTENHPVTLPSAQNVALDTTVETSGRGAQCERPL